MVRMSSLGPGPFFSYYSISSHSPRLAENFPKVYWPWYSGMEVGRSKKTITFYYREIVLFIFLKMIFDNQPKTVYMTVVCHIYNVRHSTCVSDMLSKPSKTEQF